MANDHITSEQVRQAFWWSLRDLHNHPDLVPADIPVFDEAGNRVEGPIPDVVYELMATYLTARDLLA
jgi:hypothetical protein